MQSAALLIFFSDRLLLKETVFFLSRPDRDPSLMRLLRLGMVLEPESQPPPPLLSHASLAKDSLWTRLTASGTPQLPLDTAVEEDEEDEEAETEEEEEGATADLRSPCSAMARWEGERGKRGRERGGVLLVLVDGGG